MNHPGHDSRKHIHAATLALIAHAAFGCSAASADAESFGLIPSAMLESSPSVDSAVYALASGGLETSCGTLDRPCSSLQAAADQLSLARPNLVLLPSSGVFHEGVSLTDIGAPIRVIGNDVRVSTGGASGFYVAGAQVTFDGVFVENATDREGAAIDCAGGGVVVRDSTLRASTYGVRADGCNVEVVSTRVVSNEMGIQAQSGLHGLYISASRLEGNAQAVYSDADPLTIQNNLFLRNGEDDYTRVIQMTNRTGRPFFGYNTLVGNFNNCIYVGIVACEGVDATLTSNISWNNFPSWTGSGDDCLNQVFSCRGSSVSHTIEERIWSGENNSSRDPLFVDAANDDYRLSPGSPIDQGDPARSPSSDYFGSTRPELGLPDVGAVEYAPMATAEGR